MHRRTLQAATIILALLVVPVLRAGEVIDRVIATVNRAPLLQSDLEDTVRFEAFLQQRPAASFTAVERDAALQRLIDHELLRQQMQADYGPTNEEIDARVAEVRSQCKVANDDQWRALLARYLLDDRTIRARLAAQLQILQFVELRLRPTVRIDRDAIESYYREKLVPQLQQMGAPVEPLAAVSVRIQELLAQQRMDELLNSWLANLRSQSEIHLTHESEASGHLGRTILSHDLDAKGK